MYLPIRKQRSLLLLFVDTSFQYGCLDGRCASCTLYSTVNGSCYTRYPSRLEAQTLHFSIQRLRNSDLMLKFIYHTIQTFFYSLHLLVAAKSKFILAFITPNRGGVVRRLSPPPTVHNFCSQTSVVDICWPSRNLVPRVFVPLDQRSETRAKGAGEKSREKLYRGRRSRRRARMIPEQRYCT